MMEDIILEELVRGYHINGRVLRHAQVKVSMGPGPKEDSSDEQQVDGDIKGEAGDDSQSSQEPI